MVRDLLEGGRECYHPPANGSVNMKISISFAVMALIGGFFSRVSAGEEMDGKGLLLAAKQRYDQINSYRCKATNVVVKGGLFKPTRYFNTVDYSFQKPENIRMTWLAPFLLKGQVAVFRDKELKVKIPFVPFAVKMDPDGLLTKDPAGNRIYQTHLGYLINLLLDSITPETKVMVINPTGVKASGNVAEATIENEKGRVLVWIDKRLFLPTSMEFYGPDGQLSQACVFEDLALNVDFGPGEFDLSGPSRAPRSLSE